MKAASKELAAAKRQITELGASNASLQAQLQETSKAGGASKAEEGSSKSEDQSGALQAEAASLRAELATAREELRSQAKAFEQVQAESQSMKASRDSLKVTCHLFWTGTTRLVHF